MESVSSTNQGVRISKEIVSMQGSSYSKFEILWTTDRGGDGMLEEIKLKHNRFDAPVVNGKGIYKRIMIKRRITDED